MSIYFIDECEEDALAAADLRRPQTGAARPACRRSRSHQPAGAAAVAPASQAASRVTPTAALWPLKCLCLRRMGGAPTAPAVAPALPPGSRRALLFITYTLYILVNTVVTGTMPAMSAPSELGFSSAGCQPLRLHPALAATRPSFWLRPAI
eukprot:SAG25_NODE_1866_length_2235_cov_22.992041_1_plen_151_part_00